ncbi:hypothetical protein, partial [Companilactobacillus formosensis]|uniref:hypothetical protein n=1 Tax=Companilactobacillus formosensis TaxID=1617889 RepID=UPI001B883689
YCLFAAMLLRDSYGEALASVFLEPAATLLRNSYGRALASVFLNLVVAQPPCSISEKFNN